MNLPAIPRTRASITRYVHGRPVYEETSPYRDKLPAELLALAKEMTDLTIRDALAFALAADRADPALDAIIWYKVVMDAAIAKDDAMACVGTPRPAYTASLDAAIKLYDAKPPMIATDPLDVVCDALWIKVLNAPA